MYEGDFIMKWIIFIVLAIIILFIALLIIVDRSTKLRRPGTCQVKTENGAILVCHCFDRKHYEVVDIKRQRKDIIIPDKVNSGYKITRLNFFDENGAGAYKRVKHIHLPVCMDDINENDRNKYRMNAFCCFPNLKSITVEKENPFFTACDGMIYKKGTHLLAVAPGLLGTITIGKEVKKIAKNALLDLKRAITFRVEEGNSAYKSVDGVLYTKDGKKLLQYPIAKLEAQFTIPDGVKKIREEAFWGARHLQCVVMPESLRKIGRAAFCSARMLRVVALNEKLRVMEEEAFAYTRVRQMELPKGLRTAEIGSLPVKELVIPKKLGDIWVAHDEDGAGILCAKKLYIKNPALDLNSIENYEGDSIFSCKDIYAYEGSLPYRQMMEVAEQYLITVHKLSGKKYEVPTGHRGAVDTSWYSEKKAEFHISRPEQLAGLSKLAEKENFFAGQTFYLDCDLDMNSYSNFQPIRDFNGVFEGCGRKIYNLYIYRLESYVGLFSSLDYEGEIRDLTVSGEVTGGDCTGGIVGCCEGGIVENCTFEGKVKGYGYSGKVIGYNTFA